MKITRRQLRRMIREQVENIAGEELYGIFTDPLKVPDDSPAHENILDEEYPEDVEPEEDAWSGGANLVHPIDHEDVGGSNLSTDRGVAVMRVSEGNLRKVIRRVLLREQGGRPSGPDYVAKMLTTPAAGGPNVGVPFVDIALDGLASGDASAAANAIMSALWIDDPWPEDEDALVDMLTRDEPSNEHEVADVGSRWLDQFRAGGFASEEQKQGHLKGWGSR